MCRILGKPGDLAAHIRKYVQIVYKLPTQGRRLSISHGYEVQEGVDPLVELADQATDQISRLVAFGGLVREPPVTRLSF